MAGSLPPVFAATMIARLSLLHNFARLALTTPLWWAMFL